MTISQVPACEPLIVSEPHELGGTTKAPYQAVATARFVVEKCLSPAGPVTPNEIIDIKIVWKWCELVFYDPDDIVAMWPSFAADGGQFWPTISLPPAVFQGFFYLWHLSKLHLYLGDTLVQTIGRPSAQPGQEFTWNFHGTIEQLLGIEITESTNISLNWYIGYEILVGVDFEWWPWNGALAILIDDYISNITLGRIISVEIPPPPPEYPYPAFDLDLCSISKETVAQDEKFDIKITVENQNETSGTYFIGCYCEGNYIELATGTIAGDGTKSHTFRVTANELAQRQIVTSQYLSFTIVVSNDEDETDRWIPAAIAVIVTEPPETASLSGQVMDKQTGYGLVGVAIAVSGYETSTSTGGYYHLDGLGPGKYNIEFTKDGYWGLTKTKTLSVGENNLDASMTPATEPEPSETPWKLITAGLGVMGLILIIPKSRSALRNGRRN